MRGNFSKRKLNFLAALGIIIIVAGTAAFLLFPKKTSEPGKSKEATNSASRSANENKDETGEVPSPPLPSPPTPTPPPTPSPTPTPSEISRADTSKKQMIFTFDAGSGSNSLDAILTTLRNHRLTASFFITGRWAQTYPDLVKQIAADNNEIWNHTYDHPDLTTVSDQKIRDELSQAEEIITSLVPGSTKPYFRPPYGARNQHVLDVAWSEGYRSVYWTVDALDWKESSGETADQVKQRIYDNEKNGSIVLMHIGDNITGQVLDEVLTKIQNDGYKIVPLTQGL